MGVWSTWLELGLENLAGAPVTYQGSSVVPESSDKRGGWLELAVVPNHVLAMRAGESMQISLDEQALEVYKCALARLSISDGETDVTVVLDREQARRVKEALESWLDTPTAW